MLVWSSVLNPAMFACVRGQLVATEHVIELGVSHIPQVRSVYKSPHVEDREHRNEAQIDFAHDLSDCHRILVKMGLKGLFHGYVIFPFDQFCVVLLPLGKDILNLPIWSSLMSILNMMPGRIFDLSHDGINLKCPNDIV